jgi:hypothetical protein
MDVPSGVLKDTAVILAYPVITIQRLGVQKSGIRNQNPTGGKPNFLI